ncbi:MAG TPA: type II CAAX endopeptidase family protein [Bacilli bacterium]|nr:type II CAAX endopeptidase family protein [Bacilli bacterium]
MNDNALMKFVKNEWKELVLIILFYSINFGLWEIIAPIVSKEWASLIVYVILFILVIIIFKKELVNEWKELKSKQFKNRKFWLNILIFLILDLFLSGLLIYLTSKLKLDILPQNNSTVKEQMIAVPIILTIIQGCIFAPVIEEMTFRFSIINKRDNKINLVIAFIISIVLFDCIHIVRIEEFFYYLLPSLILTSFYVKYKNVFASIILHSIINIVGYIALIIGLL